MRIYAFERTDARGAIPLAARRALEAAGCKLTAAAWRRMASGARRAISEIRAARTIEPARVRDRLGREGAAFEWTRPRRDPAHRAPPKGLAIDLSAWRALEPLDRWVLARLARAGKTEPLARACEEIVPRRLHAEVTCSTRS